MSNVKCNPGNKPCGKRCIGIDMFCHVGMTKGDSVSNGLKDLAKQFKNNRIKTTDLKPTAEEDLEYGDVVIKPLGVPGKKKFLHYGVYIGDGRVIQLDPDVSKKTGRLRISNFDDAAWQKSRPPVASKKRDLDELKALVNDFETAAKEGRTNIKYDIVLSNCERFANLITYGVPYSSQYDELGVSAKSISRYLSSKIFGSYKGVSIHEAFAHSLKYKANGVGIRKMPPIPREQVVEKLINFSEAAASLSGDIKSQYDDIRSQLGNQFDISEVDKLDQMLEVLNISTMLVMMGNDQDD